MRLLKYSRPMVLISMGFACVAINFWLITTGHYRLPLFVFLGCIFITPLILRKLPPITTDPKEIATYQLKASSSARRLAFMYSAGFAMALLSLISGGFKDTPVWATVFAFCWGGFLIWFFFRLSRQHKKSAERDANSPSETPKQ